MFKHLLLTTTALGLILSPATVAASSTNKEKPAAPAAPATKPTTEPDKKAEKKPAASKPAEKKTAEPSETDKALMAHAEKLSANLTEPQSKKLLDLLNTGDDKALQAIPGIGEVKSKALKKARPFKSVADLIMVEGVGEVTFDGIVKWTQEGMKAEVPAPKPTEKPAAKEKPAPKPPVKEAPEPKPAPTKKPA